MSFFVTSIELVDTFFRAWEVLSLLIYLDWGSELWNINFELPTSSSAWIMFWQSKSMFIPFISIYCFAFVITSSLALTCCCKINIYWSLVKIVALYFKDSCFAFSFSNSSCRRLDIVWRTWREEPVIPSFFQEWSEESRFNDNYFTLPCISLILSCNPF